MRGTPSARSLLAVAAAMVAACAHVEAPRGGPEDLQPPVVVVTRPAADTVVPGWRDPVVFVFDERLSERGIEETVLVSPRTSPVSVRHSGDEIRVSLLRGWQPGQIYQVTVLPEAQDLFNNALAAPATVTFSTGPEIPDTRLTGRVVDRVTGQPEALTRVEAIRAPDSLVYATRTDSTGRFVLEKFPAGEYRVRAFRDQNRNRALDAFEVRDSAERAVLAGEPVAVDLRVLATDTTAPRIADVTPSEGRLTVRFDDFLDPEQELSPGRVEVVGPAGEAVPVSRVAIGTLPPRDTTAAAPAPPAAPDVPPAAPDPPQGSAALPSQTLVVELAEGAALAPGAELVLRVRAIRNVNGLVADAEHEFTAPPAADADRVPPGAPPG